MAERDDAAPGGYGDWRSLELAIKDAAKKASAQAGPGVSAASIDAQIWQARYDRFLSRVFAEGEQSEWLLKGGMSMLALAALAEADLGDHLTFRLIRAVPTGLGGTSLAWRRGGTSSPASTPTRAPRSTQ
jgi:hypothetical protein